jgi:hypothetical protein
LLGTTANTSYVICITIIDTLILHIHTYTAYDAYYNDTYDTIDTYDTYDAYLPAGKRGRKTSELVWRG